MDTSLINNSSPQPSNNATTTVDDQIQSVTEQQRKKTEESVISDEEAKRLEKIQEELKKNKVLFYGLPVAVLVYGVLVVFLFVIPSIQTYFKVSDTKRILDKNLTVYKTTSENIQDARQKLSDYDKYEKEVTDYIPTDSQLGSLINLIQTKASDFALEQQVNAPAKDSTASNSTINNISGRNDDDNALFESINSGVIRFVPKGLSEDTEAKLLAIDVDIKGRKTNFFRFLSEMEKSKPIVNLVYLEYQETNLDSASGDTTIQATLRFESYNLTLGDSYNDLVITKFSASDPSLLVPATPETFDLNIEIIQEFSEGQ